MRKRIYWLLPDLGSARRTMDELLLARITEHHIHFAASEGAAMEGLHAANVLQTSDLVEAAQSGALIGSGLGAAGGVAAWRRRWPSARHLRRLSSSASRLWAPCWAPGRPA